LSKGEQTREMILQRAAQVFNRRGYFGASLADIMEATGMEKGGIYNHFSSKDDLALQAFDYAVDLVRQSFAEATRDKPHNVDRLLGVVSVFSDMSIDSPVSGGCPVLNTAVEADDAHPLLRERAQQAMDEWHNYIHRTVTRGIEKGQIRPDANPDTLATLIVATLEGAIMLSKLYGSQEHMKRAVNYLTEHLNSVRL
jgi:AcrR family transcriptional regulator